MGWDADIQLIHFIVQQKLHSTVKQLSCEKKLKDYQQKHLTALMGESRREGSSFQVTQSLICHMGH